MNIENIAYLIIGAALTFMVGIGVDHFKKLNKKKRLTRMIRDDFDLIHSGMKSTEKEKIQRWQEALNNPNVAFMASSYYPNPAVLEELDVELYDFKDPVPRHILYLQNHLRFYRHLHQILVQRCIDLGRGTQSFDEFSEKLLTYKEYLWPTVRQIEEVRRKIIKEIESSVQVYPGFKHTK